MRPRARLAVVAWLFVLCGTLVARDGHAQTACTVPAQCQQLDAPVCNAGLCGPCLTNYSPANLPTGCPSPSMPYCQMGDSGAIGGSCTQCGPGAGNSSLCDATHPVCVDGTCGCTDSSQCTGGLTCDQGTQSCVLADGGATDGGASDSGPGDGGVHDAGLVDGGASDAGREDGGGADGSAGDAATTDGSTADDATSGDGEVGDDATTDAGGGDATEGDGGEVGSTGADGAASDAGPIADDEGGAAGSGDYILGGGCACTTGPAGTANGVAALVTLAFACAAMGRRRSR